MIDIPLDLFTAFDPVWTLSISPFIGFLFLYFVEKWMLYTPKTIPWWGGDKGIFSRIKACIRDNNESMLGLKGGYAKHGSKGLPFVKPDALFTPEIMVPREHLRWVLDQPQDVLSVHEARYEKFALNYVLPGHDDAVDRVFLDTIHKKMTRNLLKLQGAFGEEISTNVDKFLGTDTENWTEVNVWQTVEAAVFSAVMRVLVGKSVCRNDNFRQEIGGFTKAFGLTSIFVGRMLPKFLKPTVGWILSRFIVIKQRNLLRKWFNPLVEERFTNLLKQNQDPTFEYDAPQDLVTWASENLMTTGNVERCTPNDLSRRLAIMIPAALPAIKTTTTNVIYDIISSSSESQVQELVKNEIDNALDTSEGKGWADQALLPRLVLLNSVARETLRYNPVSIVTLERKVLPKEGVTLPSGQHLPKGTWLAVPTVGVHYDEKVWPNADKYEPFRHCNRKPGEESATGAPVTSQGVVNVTDTFLPFGAGKFACPGRWLAAHVVKLTVAYLLYNYEIKPWDERPLNHALFGTNMPDRTATMMVRRRKH